MFALFSLFLTGYFIAWPILLVLLIVGMLASRFEAYSLSFICGIVVFILVGYTLPTNLVELLIYAVLYILLGTVWSFPLYKRFLTNKKKELIEENRYCRDFKLEEGIKKYQPTKILDLISIWIVGWPGFFVNILLLDYLLKIPRTIAKKILIRSYQRIYEVILRDN